MSTTTPIYGLTLPAVGSPTDQDLWGNELNGDLTQIEGLLAQGINLTPSAETTSFAVTAPTAGSSAGQANNVFLCDCTSGGITASLPTVLAAGTGFRIAFKKIDSTTNPLTITAGTTVATSVAELIDGSNSIQVLNQYGYVVLVCNGTGWNIVTQTSREANGTAKQLTGAYTSTNSATFTAAHLVVKSGANSTGLLNYSQVVNISASGAGGLDSGTVAASTWYAVYAIYNGLNASILLSLSYTAPTLPTGYTYSAYIGSIRINASMQVAPFIQRGRKSQYPSPVGMAAGLASAWSAIAVSPVVPPTATGIKIMAYAACSGGTQVAIAPNSSYGSTTLAPFFFENSGSSQAASNALIEILLESANVYWASSFNGAGLFCLGWEDNAVTA